MSAIARSHVGQADTFCQCSTCNTKRNLHGIVQRIPSPKQSRIRLAGSTAIFFSACTFVGQLAFAAEKRIEFDDQFLRRLGSSPNFDFGMSLQNHVVGENSRKRDVARRNGTQKQPNAND